MVILGAGGAARAALVGLADIGATRNPDRESNPRPRGSPCRKLSLTRRSGGPRDGLGTTARTGAWLMRVCWSTPPPWGCRVRRRWISTSVRSAGRLLWSTTSSTRPWKPACWPPHGNGATRRWMVWACCCIRPAPGSGPGSGLIPRSMTNLRQCRAGGARAMIVLGLTGSIGMGKSTAARHVPGAGRAGA